MQAIITNLAAMATAAGGKIILALLVLIIGNILIKSVLKFLGKSKMMEDKAGRKILCKRFSTKSRMVLKSRADSGLNPLVTESHGGQNGMRAGTA